MVKCPACGKTFATRQQVSQHIVDVNEMFPMIGLFTQWSCYQPDVPDDTVHRDERSPFFRDLQACASAPRGLTKPRMSRREFILMNGAED